MTQTDPTAARQALKLTQSELAQLAGCSRSTVARWEKRGRAPRWLWAVLTCERLTRAGFRTPYQ